MNDTWVPVCWDGGDGDFTDANWTGLVGGDNYPGESGSEDYCVVIDTGTAQDKDEVVIDEFIQVRSTFVGTNAIIKIKPGGDLQLSRAGAIGGSGTGGSGATPSFDCDGEVWISSGSNTGTAPGRFALDGGSGVSENPECILNGRIVFYQESGAGTDPGVFTRTKCSRLACDDSSPCTAYVENDSTNPARGIVANTFTDTFTWSDGMTFRGDLEIGPYIWDEADVVNDLGTLDANTSGKSVNMITGYKKAMGTYKASGGDLVVGNAGSSGPTVTGPGTWDLDTGKIQFTSYVIATGITGPMELSGGTFDVDANVTTTKKLTVDGSCTLDIATSKTLSVTSIEIGSDAGAVTLTRAGAGDLETT